MDRTVIPNGAQEEDVRARPRFRQFCDSDDVSLVYVTGRHLQLALDAVERFELPVPDFIVTDVGTKIYAHHPNGWQELTGWCEEIDHDWHGCSHADLARLFADLADLQLQEAAKQNVHKLSYYVSLDINEQPLIAQMEHRLVDHQIEASLIWSVDEPNNIGLLDVLPRNATKLHAVEFLQAKLDYALNEVVFAGDSGNDLPVMGSVIPAALVANAAEDVCQTAQAMAQQNGTSAALYIASGKGSDMNGNYCAGVLEGVGHYMVEMRPQLELLGFQFD